VSILRILAKTKAKSARRSFETAVRNPVLRQDQVWKETLLAIRKGSFWDRVSSDQLKDFPITDYSFYQEAFEKDLSQETTSLTGEKIIFWAESSGTTGSIKHFPLTRLYQNQFQKVNLPFAASIFSLDDDFFRNSILYLAAPASLQKTPTGIEKGLISGFNYRNIPALLTRKYALPNSFLTQPKAYAVWSTRYALLSDLGTIFSIAPSKISSLIQEINDQRAELLKWIESGYPTDESLPRPRVSQARLKKLAKALASTEKLTARKIWPHLKLIACWKTGPCRAQMGELAQWVESDVIRLDAMYTATEAWMTVPLTDQKDGGPIHPDAVLCEFIEEGKEIKPENLIPMTALEAGKTYEIFVTSLMGVIRYRMFDLVRCNGFYHGSPIIEFIQKSSQVLSMGWTRVSETDLYQAFQTLSYPADPSGRFLFSLNEKENGIQAYEFADAADGSSVDFENFDRALQKVNPYYQSDRKKGVIQTISIQKLPLAKRDQFYGRTHLQSKPTLLTKVRTS
jgi:hypothetical protein